MTSLLVHLKYRHVRYRPKDEQDHEYRCDGHIEVHSRETAKGSILRRVWTMLRELLGRSLEIPLADHHSRGDNGWGRATADLARKYVGGHHEKQQWMQYVV